VKRAVTEMGTETKHDFLQAVLSGGRSDPGFNHITT
jgi:hypothetical protein